MTKSSSDAESKSEKRGGLIRALVLFAAASCAILVLCVLRISQSDPFVKATISLEGSAEKGSQLFRMNCTGCHGINAQGLLAPDLHEVSDRYNDSQLIHQIVDGRTPPMPSFQMDPQAMSDLLAHLHSLEKK